MNTTCRQCGRDSGGKKYCCHKCQWTWHNQNRTLTPNAIYDCEVCGAHVEKWVAPSRVASGQSTNRFCGRTCAGKWRSGKNHPMWSGGRTKDKDGYWMVHMPGHRHADHRGYVREHRIVMEKKIGRPLKKAEVVHHINDDPGDNRPENLRLYKNNAAHKADDANFRTRDTKGRFEKK